MGSEVIVVLPLPPKALSPNARVSWRKRAAATRQYREVAYWATVQVRGCGRPRPWPRAVAQVTFYWPYRQRRDIRNAEAQLKPAYDGIVEAGLIVDDNSDVLTHQPTQFAIDPRRPRVEIRVCRMDGRNAPSVTPASRP